MVWVFCVSVLTLTSVAVSPADAKTPRNMVGVTRRAAKENPNEFAAFTSSVSATQKLAKFDTDILLGSHRGGYPSTIDNTEPEIVPRACKVQGAAKLVVVLVVCDENIDWIRRFGALEIELIVYYKCGKGVNVSGRQVITESRGLVLPGPRSKGAHTGSLHTYLSHLIKIKQEDKCKSCVYLYMRPSLLVAFDKKGKKHVYNATSSRERGERFFRALGKLTEGQAHLQGIGYMSIGDTNSRYIDVCSIFSAKGSRFPAKLATSWRGNGLPCRFYHTARTQVFMSAYLIEMIPIDVLHLWLAALDSVKKKPGTKKTGRNYFRLKLELVRVSCMGRSPQMPRC